jgi:hypothetical protein
MVKSYWRLLITSTLLVSSCAEPNNPDANNPDAVAQDYCAEVIEYLGDFYSSVYRGMNDESIDVSAELKITAKKLALIAVRAENDGLELATPEAAWLIDLKKSSLSLIHLIDGEADGFSDDELHHLLSRMLYDFSASEEKCSPSEA